MYVCIYVCMYVCMYSQLTLHTDLGGSVYSTGEEP